MAIRKVTAFEASDGSPCKTLEEAQRHELALVWMAHATLADDATEVEKDRERKLAVDFAHLVQGNADAVLEILTTGPRSRPSTRARKGTTNPKRAAKATPEAAKAGFKAMRGAVDREADNSSDMAAERLRQSESEVPV